MERERERERKRERERERESLKFLQNIKNLHIMSKALRLIVNFKKGNKK